MSWNRNRIYELNDQGWEQAQDDWEHEDEGHLCALEDMLPPGLSLKSQWSRYRDTSVKVKNQFDALSWLQDEVQSTEVCMCEVTEPTSEWVKIGARLHAPRQKRGNESGQK